MAKRAAADVDLVRGHPQDAPRPGAALVVLLDAVDHLARRPSAAAGSRPGRAARSGRRRRRGSTWRSRRTRPCRTSRRPGPAPPGGGGTTPRARRGRTRLEPRLRRRRPRRPRRMQGDGVERLGVEPLLVGQVEDRAAARAREGLDLLKQRRPFGHGQPVEEVGREPADLGQLEDEEGALLDARRPGGRSAGGGSRPAARRAARCIPGPRGPCRPGRSGRAAGGPPGTRPGCPGGTGWTTRSPRTSICCDHPAPAAQGQQRGGDEGLPLRLGHARAVVERLADRLQRADPRVLQPAQLRGQPRIQRAGGPPGWRYSEQKARIEPLVAIAAAARRPRPGPGTPRRSGSAGRGRADRRPRPSPPAAGRGAATAAGGGGVNGGSSADPVAADPPERLERERLPSRRRSSSRSPTRRTGRAARPGSPARAAPPVPAPMPLPCGSFPPRRSRITQRRVSAISRARTAEETSGRTRRSASVSATYQTSSSVGPVRSGYWSIASRSSSRVPKPGIVSPARSPRSSSQDLLQLGEPDPARASAPRGSGPRSGRAGSRRPAPLLDAPRGTAGPRRRAACCGG